MQISFHRISSQLAKSVFRISLGMCSLTTAVFAQSPQVSTPSLTEKKAVQADTSIRWHCEAELFNTLMQFPSPKTWQVQESNSNLMIRTADSFDPNIQFQIFQDSSESILKVFNTKTNQNSTFVFSANRCALVQKWNSEQAQSLRSIKMRNKNQNAVSSNLFDDASLAKVQEISKQQPVLLYFWSPRMTLSITGAQEAQKIAKDLNLKMILILDNRIDAHEQSLALAKSGFENSLVLANTNTNHILKLFSGLHYPSWVIYKDAQTSSVLRMGYSVPTLMSEEIKGRL